MTNQIPIRGNICSCGEVWFCYDLPESDPDKCPYCKREIDKGEVYNEDEIQERDQSDELPENVKSGIEKATGKTSVKLVSKVCDFCTNELFFDADDAPKATDCPYCDGKLISVEEFQTLVTGKYPEEEDKSFGVSGVDINELEGEMVFVKFKSFNPFNKPLAFVFGGVDPMSGMVKLIGLQKEIVWVNIKRIKSITHNG